MKIEPVYLTKGLVEFSIHPTIFKNRGLHVKIFKGREPWVIAASAATTTPPARSTIRPSGSIS
jgi:hypothetical protein